MNNLLKYVTIVVATIPYLISAQNTDTLYLYMPNNIAIYSPCRTLECIDTIYILRDSIIVDFIDNTEYDAVRYESRYGNNSPTYVSMYVIANAKKSGRPILIVPHIDITAINYLKINYIDWSFYFRKKENSTFKYKMAINKGIPDKIKPTIPYVYRKW
jgi:hypothetical protein